MEHSEIFIQCNAVVRAECLKNEGYDLAKGYSCMSDVPATEEKYARFREVLGQEFFTQCGAQLEDPTPIFPTEI